MTNHQDLIIFDIANMQAVEHSSVLPRQVVAHDVFSKALSIADLSCFSSLRMFKGRLFVLVCRVQFFLLNLSSVKQSQRLLALEIVQGRYLYGPTGEVV